MSPLLIEIVQWYLTRTTDYRDGDFSAPAVGNGLNFLASAGLIKPTGSAPRFVITKAGRVYCKALQAVPIPRETWVIDWPTTQPSLDEAGGGG